MLIFQNSVIYLYFSLFSCGLKISESVETHYLEITDGNMQEIFRKALTLIQNMYYISNNLAGTTTRTSGKDMKNIDKF